MSEKRVITKYDYLRYFTRISKFWFHSNLEIDTYIQNQLHAQEVEDDEQESEEFDAEFEMYDFDDLNKSDGKKDQKTAQMIEGNLIEEEFAKYVQKEYPHLKKIDLRAFKNTNELVQKTDAAIKQDNCLIMQATFFSARRNAVCKTDFLIVEEGAITILEVKGTTTVKRKHFLDTYYQYQIATDAGYKIADVMMGIIRFERLNRGQISFLMTPNCQLSVENSEQAKARYLEEHGGNETKATQARKLGELSGTRFNLLQGIKGEAEFQGNGRSLKTWQEFWSKWNNEYNFDKVLAELQDWKVSELQGHLEEDDLDYPQLLTSQFYEYAPEVRAILAKTEERYGFSGVISALRWRKVQEQKGVPLTGLAEKIENNDLVANMVRSGTSQIDKTAATASLMTIKPRQVFFDFESINPAVRAADETYPFQQVVTQCSVITSEDVSQRNNLIIDPQAVTRKWWEQVVASIHRGREWSYVVYNKSFECSRLKEMGKILSEQLQTQKINEINENVYDLADLFDVRKKLTALAELKGYYSIKKVLPLARSKIARPISKDYEKLEVQKGTDAMELTMKRHFGEIDSEEWKKAEKLLCEYCENDVLAMIDVLTYARNLLA